MMVSETAIRTTGFADLYLVLTQSAGGAGWTVRLFYQPLVPWIWLGGVMMAAGGVLSLTDRRFRIGVPARRLIPAAAQ
jgi:cytochrome c-type biogenesis protein CcmF